MAAWQRALVRKELRALGPTWLACAAVAAFGAWVGGRAALVLASSAGAFMLGAWSLGHEYAHHTLPALLSQPVSRRQIAGVKAAVLAALMLALGVVAAPLAFVESEWFSGAARSGSLWGARTTVVISGVAAFCLAPWFTMLGRGALAGLVFSLATVSFTWLAGDVIGIAMFGLAAGARGEIDAFRTSFMWVTTVPLSAFGAWMSWRTFRRLEAHDGGAAAAVLSRLRPVSAARAGSDVARRRTHWVRQLVAKELQLQKMVFAIAGLYLLMWWMLVASRQFVPANLALPLAPFTMLYAAAVPLLLGSFASAEERQLGTLSWQTLMPVPAWRQWTVKVLVACGLAFGLGFGLPAALESVTPLNGSVDAVLEIEASLAIVFATIVSMYVSSVSTGGLRALVASMVAMAPMAALFGGFGRLFSGTSDVAVGLLREAGWYRGGYFALLPKVDVRGLDAVVLAAATVLAILLLRFAYVNHRSADTGMRRLWRQPAWISVWVLGMAVVFGTLHAASLDDWRITGVGGVRVTGYARFDGTAARPRVGHSWVRLLKFTAPRSSAVGNFADDGTFTTTYSRPGPHLVSVFALGTAPWAVKSVTYHGRDISESEVDLATDIDDVIVTFSDHMGTVTGTVETQGKPLGGGVSVFLFPADSTLWTSIPVMVRRSASRWLPPSTQVNATFTFDMPPDGEYLLVAVPDRLGQPLAVETRARLAALADRIQAREGTTITRTLTVKPWP
jgi:hypothetical protein